MRIDRRNALSQIAIGSVLNALLGRAASAETTTYEYDVHGRLVKVTFNGGQVVEYAYDAAGNRTQLARVSGPPSITSFSASPSSISSGNSTTLSRSTTNATSVSINNGVGPVALSGNRSESPNATTTYTLTASGPGGSADTEQVTVTVTPGGFNQTIQVTGGGPVNLRTLANSNGYSGAQNATVVFEVSNGVTITGAAGDADSAGGIAIDSGTWPTGSYTINITLTIKSGGIVRGGGGGGGSGSTSEGVNNPGGNGGDAIYCRLPMIVNINSGGEVKGGGAGGQGGAPVDPNPFDENPADGYGGGGGGGAPNGTGGAGANSGANGTTSGGGAGGAGSGDGGAGSSGATYGQPSGPGGYCVRKNGHTVTVNNSGATAGTIG